MKKVGVLDKKNSQILFLIFIFLIMSFAAYSSTSGNAGFLQNLVNWLKTLNTGIKVVFSLGAVACIGFGIFKMITDPNMGAILVFLLGVAFALTVIFGSEDIVTGLGGTMIDFNSLGGM